MSTDETDEAGATDAVTTHPADVFAPVAEETRVEILRAFADEQRRIGEAFADADQASAEDLIPGFTFTELFERVDVEDSGRFNYHLDKLTGQYVTKLDEETYAPTWAGVEVAGAVLAGGYGDHEIERTEIDRSCPSCGSGLAVQYDDGYLIVSCTESDDPVLLAGVPAGVFEGRSLADAVDVAAAHQRRLQEAVTDGYCPLCYGDVTASLAPSTTEGVVSDAAYQFRGVCDRCGNVFLGGLASLLFRHPAVVGFYHDHGEDPRDAYTDAFDPVGEGDEITTVVSESPPQVVVEFELDDETLAVTVDEDATVVDTERRPT
ncbi:hypothetical protein RYH80_06300 [Halobaculum sp. MBLA0147]|uniref:DUF7351 domain-containing protein n=1 Tax=Halobaculum sp. MBLA0147 TaxID=3079934 RepID=UPI00352693DF